MTDVVDLLTSLYIKAKPGPYGVEFEWYFERGNFSRTGDYKYRVERGSGIAGRGDAWNLHVLPGGGRNRDSTHEVCGPKVTTRALLKRQVLEALAEGTKPPDRDGYETYARWHRYGTTSSVQWFQRRKRRRPIHLLKGKFAVKKKTCA